MTIFDSLSYDMIKKTIETYGSYELIYLLNLAESEDLGKQKIKEMVYTAIKPKNAKIAWVSRINKDLFLQELFKCLRLSEFEKLELQKLFEQKRR